MSEKPKSYNGYPNYYTWVISLHYSNDETQWYCISLEAKKHLRMYPKDTIYHLAIYLENYYRDNSPCQGCSVYSDLMSHTLAHVDWGFLADQILKSISE